jgi:hypothetical protein
LGTDPAKNDGSVNVRKNDVLGLPDDGVHAQESVYVESYALKQSQIESSRTVRI